MLADNYHKDIIIEALKRRVDKKEVVINAFVIMPNHFHIIWKVANEIDRSDFQRDLLKFTARSSLKFMFMNDDPLLRSVQVKAGDRKQQIWKRNPLSIELITEAVFLQKLEYIHNNPLQPKWSLCSRAEDYKYSSAGFYETGIDRFGILTDFRD